MKSIIIITAILSTLFCKPQSPILSLYIGESNNIENAYYKDINSVHDQYVGTWLYTNGQTSFKIKLKKKEMIYVSGHFANFYMDFLVGEYQYIENGVEKVNTHDNINQIYVDNSQHNLYAYALQGNNNYPKCNECEVGEKRLVMSINEPSKRHLSGLSDQFIIRPYFDNSVEKLKVWFHNISNGIVTDDNTGELSDVESFSLPYGEYTLIKQ